MRTKEIVVRKPYILMGEYHTDLLYDEIARCFMEQYGIEISDIEDCLLTITVSTDGKSPEIGRLYDTGVTTADFEELKKARRALHNS